MMRGILTLAMALFVTNGLFAQLESGKKNIKSLCGCYEVKFKYAETFSPDPNYKYRERDDMSEALELIIPIEESENKIVLQHLLLVTDSMVIKHWREDWTYENPELWKYEGDHKWKRTALDASAVKGKWTQSVWEVSDAPRYQGVGEWVNLDGQTFWQNTTDAPLPRREYTTRHDYNVLRRTNRIILGEGGWIHEQDNRKLIRKDGADKLLVEEKGFNTYERTDDAKCKVALAFWQKHETFWATVRTAWDKVLKSKNEISLETKVDGRPMHVHLDEAEKKKEAVEPVISKFSH